MFTHLKFVHWLLRWELNYIAYNILVWTSKEIKFCQTILIFGRWFAMFKTANTSFERFQSWRKTFARDNWSASTNFPPVVHWSTILMAITTEQGSFWALYHFHIAWFSQKIFSFLFWSLHRCLPSFRHFNICFELHKW